MDYDELQHRDQRHQPFGQHATAPQTKGISLFWKDCSEREKMQRLSLLPRAAAPQAKAPAFGGVAAVGMSVSLTDPQAVCSGVAPSVSRPSIAAPCWSSSSMQSARPSRRREFCHFTDALSSSLLKHLLHGEGGAAERQNSRRKASPAERGSPVQRGGRPRHRQVRVGSVLRPPASEVAGVTAEMINPGESACESSLSLRAGRR